MVLRPYNNLMKGLVYHKMITVIILVYAIVAIIVTFVVIFFCYPFLEDDDLADLRKKCMLNMVLRPLSTHGIWQYHIEGENNIMDDQYIIISNHRSFVDSLVLMEMPLNFRFLIAQCFYDIPVVGWISGLVGDVPVDKKDSETKKKCIDHAISIIREGKSLIIYPEGRRSLVLPMLDKFNHGAFTIAKETGCKILPITLTGTETALFGETYITMYINEPFQVYDIEESIEEVKKIMRSHMENVV